MTQVLSLAARHMVHSPMDLDKLSLPAPSSSSSPIIGESSSSSSSSSRSGIMRRSSVSMGTAAGNPPGHDSLEQLRINTSSATARPEGSRDLICLCTPTPKIPRPRNAFILYRQHHQSQVTAENPRLSNPEISKIIGDKWKNEVSEVKDRWKKLAEEEKQRHQHQYPNYRYQPRRGAKSGNWPGSSTAEDQGRCSKCNGRFIATPRTPSTPFATPGAGGAEAHARPSLHRLDTDIPRRASMELSPINKLPVPGKLPSFRSPEEFDPASPEIKRRRANGAGDYHLVSGRPDMYGGLTHGEPMRLASDGGPMMQTKLYGSTSLPDLAGLPRSNSFPMPPMPPPPRPAGTWPWVEQGSHSRRNSGFDESLRLPPLQNAMAPSPSRTIRGDERHASTSSKGSLSPIQRDPFRRSMEARGPEFETMSISFRHKLRVLARICQPAPPLSREGPSTGIRGALIAIEGPSAGMLREVGMAVERGLARYAEIALRVWTNDCDAAEPGAEDSFSSCFQTVLSWRDKSKQIVRHVTGSEETHGLSQPQDANKGKSPADEKSPVLAGRIPVALVKEGFSLTLSDRFACAAPIIDMYAPVDHWQWMASLWRGIVCPDLVIYVKPSEEDEISALGTVEFSRSMGLIVVRVVPGRSLDEATERRLAFEVMEWMREGSFREAVPPNWRLE